MTVFASSSLYGSASATIENRKGEPVADGLTSTLDFDSESTELFATPDYEVIVDEPDAEERDLADTLLSDDVREE